MAQQKQYFTSTGKSFWADSNISDDELDEMYNEMEEPIQAPSTASDIVQPDPVQSAREYLDTASISGSTNITPPIASGEANAEKKNWYDPIFDPLSDIGSRTAEKVAPSMGWYGPATKFVGGAVDDLTSPAGALSTLAGGPIKALGMAGKGLYNLGRAASGAYGVHGASEVIRPDATGMERGLGGLEAILGVLGAKGSLSRGVPKANPLDEIGQGLADDIPLSAPMDDVIPPDIPPQVDEVIPSQLDDIDDIDVPVGMKSGYYTPEGGSATLVDGAEMGLGGNTKIIRGIDVPVKSRGQGQGKNLLNQIIKDADDTGTKLALEIQGDSTGGLSPEQLGDWYSRNGFQERNGIWYRKPQAKTIPPIADDIPPDIMHEAAPPTKPFDVASDTMTSSVGPSRNLVDDAIPPEGIDRLKIRMAHLMDKADRTPLEDAELIKLGSIIQDMDTGIPPVKPKKPRVIARSGEIIDANTGEIIQPVQPPRTKIRAGGQAPADNFIQQTLGEPDFTPLTPETPRESYIPPRELPPPISTEGFPPSELPENPFPTQKSPLNPLTPEPQQLGLPNADTPKPKMIVNTDGTFSPAGNPKVKMDGAGNIIPPNGGSPPPPRKPGPPLDANGKAIPKEKLNLWREALQIPRAIMASIDLPPFRQGASAIYHKAWWTAWGDMMKSYGSKTGFEIADDAVRSHPLFKKAQEAGVVFTDRLTLTEENYASKIANKFPLIKASHRAHTAFLNKLKMDLYASLDKSADWAASGPEGRNLTLDFEKNKVYAKQLADFVNDAAGRGSLGKLQEHAELLNAGLFSPGLIASRVRMLNRYFNPYKYYKNYKSGNTQLNKEALKSVLGLAGLWTTTALAFKQAGAEVSMDPSSTDFLKVKIGNYRLDPGAGFQQYLVAAYRLGSGTRTNTKGKSTDLGQTYLQTSGTVLADFAMNKVNPTIGVGLDFLTANKSAPVGVGSTILSLTTPIISQDVKSLAQENPWLLGTLPLAASGMGANVFGDRESDNLIPKDWDISYGGGNIIDNWKTGNKLKRMFR